MYRVTPDELESLSRSLEAVVRAFKIACGQSLNDDPRARTSGSAWRAWAQSRYRQGTFKHSILQFVPFRLFAPVDIYGRHRAELIARHPHRAGTLDVATSNALRGLVDAGLIAKLGPALYAPAIDHVALYEADRTSAQSVPARFEQFLSTVNERVAAEAPELSGAHAGATDRTMLGLFRTNVRSVSVARVDGDDEHVVVSGHEPGSQLFANFGRATEIAMNADGAALLARAIAAWLREDDEGIRAVRYAVGLERLAAS